MRLISRWFAWLYASLVLCAFVYAAASDFALRNDPGEHMLPDFVLTLVCAPLDILLLRLLPSRFLEALGWAQIVLFATAGGVQAAFLLWLTRPAVTGERPA
jgi:hypothetical protein